jgi:hypothetical protein
MLIIVPVYDGRKGFKISSLGFLKDLPTYDGELVGSVSLVGYTANTWRKETKAQLSLNIQWVVVLAA